MKTLSKIILTTSVMVLPLMPVQANKIAVGPKVSTLGIGLEASAQVNEYVSLNANVNGFKFSKGINKSDVKYNGHLRLLTIGASANIHPFKNEFRLTGGAFYNLNKLDIKATPTKNITISGDIYTPAQLGRLDGSIDFRKISPYVGIGYDSNFYNDSSWSFNGDLGVLFQGTPRVRINSSRTLTQSSQMIQDLNADVKKAVNKSYIKFYPVISLGVKYRF